MVGLPVFYLPHVRFAGLNFPAKQKWGIIGLIRTWNWKREDTWGCEVFSALSLSIPGLRACRIYDAIS